MPRCTSCNQSRWVHLRFHRQLNAIIWLTGCVPYRCYACRRRGWHRAHRVPPMLVALWRVIAHLSPRPAWGRFRLAARNVHARIRVDLRPFKQILSTIAIRAQSLSSVVSRGTAVRPSRLTSSARTLMTRASLHRPRLAVPAVIAAAVVVALWAGSALFSTGMPAAPETATSAVIDAPDAVGVGAGLPPLGTPVAAPVPPLLRAVKTSGVVENAEPARRTGGNVKRAADRRPSSTRPKPAAAIASKTTQPAVSPVRANEPRFHGTLSISSEPIGALVWVNGELVGRTPVVLKKVAAGSVVVRVESEGYERWSMAPRVVANRETSIVASLQRASGQ